MKLIQLIKKHDSQPIWVNIDAIQCIIPMPGETVIYFTSSRLDEEGSIRVQDTVRDIKSQIKLVESDHD